MNKTFAATIVEQLGGNKFLAMTGAKNLVRCDEKKYLQMDLTRNMGGVNRLQITLNANDTYTMKFYRHSYSRKNFQWTVSNEKEYAGVYCDMLRDIFTKVTGQYTSL